MGRFALIKTRKKKLKMEEQLKRTKRIRQRAGATESADLDDN